MPFYESQTFTERFRKTYRKATAEMQAPVDATILQLVDNPELPGLRVKPIRHAGYYYEARINRGDRLIFRAEGRHLILVDFVPHDRIGRYGSTPSSPG